jgi:hypothetical protein
MNRTTCKVNLTKGGKSHFEGCTFISARQSERADIPALNAPLWSFYWAHCGY